MMNELSIRFKSAYDHLISINKVSGYKDFALQLGVSTSMITEIFKGRSNVGATALQNIVLLFDINGNWLFTGLGEMVIKKTTEHIAPIEQPTPKIEQSTPKEEYITTKEESILYRIYKEKDTEVGTLKEEIGRLKEQIERLRNNSGRSRASTY